MSTSVEKKRKNHSGFASRDFFIFFQPRSTSEKRLRGTKKTGGRETRDEITILFFATLFILSKHERETKIRECVDRRGHLLRSSFGF